MQLSTLKRACQLAVAGTVLALGAFTGTASADTTPAEVYSPVSAADIANPQAYDDGATATGTVGIQSADSAVAWYSSRKGSTAYQGYCEKAARLSWNRTTHHASAIEHWNSSDGAKHTTGTPPKGAFVFWNISQYGHVGIADGSGGFWATSVNGAIGHGTSLGYFSNYFGYVLNYAGQHDYQEAAPQGRAHRA